MLYIVSNYVLTLVAKCLLSDFLILYDKAAQLCYGIANNHPFTDGNKRTALHSMYVYLIINGFDIPASQQEVENLIINVAAGNMTNVELAYWLEKNTIEIYKNI